MVKYDLLITNGIVIDGSGASERRADILIKNERIAWIGSPGEQSASAASRVINADGRIITPGFIDTHAHGDPFTTPDFENFSAQGVTTICLGQDGDSPPREDLGEWMNEVENRSRPAINISLFCGHGTIRHLSGVDFKSDPSPDEVDRMRALVRDAMNAGCLGMTTGLEYNPGYHAGLDELSALAREVGLQGGLVMSHMRSEDDDSIEQAIDELIAQGRNGNCHVHVSHLKVVHAKGRERAHAILDRMKKARNDGIQITADLYPYTASCTTIGLIFPEWAKPPNNYMEIVKSRRSDLENYLRKIVEFRNGPDATQLVTAPWAGKTLSQVAAENGKHYVDLLIDDIGPDGASAAYFVIDPNVMEELIIDPHVMICTDGSPEMLHPRSYGAFARVLRKFVKEQSILTLEQAIHKMTGLPAQSLGLDKLGRGFVKEGMVADLLIFDADSVRDCSTFEEPTSLAEGFDYVIVAGKILRESGAQSTNRNGQILRKSHGEI